MFFFKCSTHQKYESHFLVSKVNFKTVYEELLQFVSCLYETVEWIKDAVNIDVATTKYCSYQIPNYILYYII